MIKYKYILYSVFLILILVISFNYLIKNNFIKDLLFTKQENLPENNYFLDKNVILKLINQK